MAVIPPHEDQVMGLLYRIVRDAGVVLAFAGVLAAAPEGYKRGLANGPAPVRPLARAGASVIGRRA